MNFKMAKKTVFCFMAGLFLFLMPLNAVAQDGGYSVFSDLWLKSVLRTSAGSFTLVWKEVGRDTTPTGDNVVSGYFYADPAQFAYGSQYNPEIFVKIYVASNGWANIAFNHVTVDPVDVYSAHRYNGTAQKSGSVTLSSRLEEHSYTGVSGGPDDPGNSEDSFTASGTARTDSSVNVQTASGAGVFVPVGAVAPGLDGNVGTTVFSIERDNSLSPALPEGEKRISDIYRFGPSGFNFQQAVSVTVPLSSTETVENAALYRMNETSGEIEMIGGVFDAAAGTITGQTAHFSPIFGASVPADDSAAGCILLDNSGASQYTWRNVCPSEILEFYYPGAAPFEGMASVSPDGCTSGWCNQIKYIVPQGRYRLCVETWTKEFQSDLPRLVGHKILPEIADVGKPYRYPRYDISETVRLGNLVMDQEGPCPCSSVPTSSVGTGDLGITLIWHSSVPVDLDLWVTEPGGNMIYYEEPISSTGGKLDIDNQCDDYVAGRPENIFWKNAPAGDYKVQVNWFDICNYGSSLSSVSYEVRVVNKGKTKTFTGNISANATVSVTTVDMQ